MSYNDNNTEEPIWIKVVGDFDTTKELQKVIDNLDIDFGDDSRLLARTSKKRGLHIVKDPEPFQDYEADAVRDVLTAISGIDELYFSYELETSESFGF